MGDHNKGQSLIIPFIDGWFVVHIYRLDISLLVIKTIKMLYLLAVIPLIRRV